MTDAPMQPDTPTSPGTAVVLLSGGADSATCLAVARSAGHACHCLTFSYGQRHAQEVAAARRIARRFNAASHRVIEIDLRAFGGSALTDESMAVPKSDAPFHQPTPGEIPVTYVPARNTIFLSYALGLAEVLEAASIYIGVNAVDYSGYPDCRPEYVRAFQHMADLATRAGVEGHGVRILTPLMHLSKAQILRTGMDQGVDFAQTHSCYDPGDSGRACGRCDSCRIRAAAFVEIGLTDPALA